MKKMFEGSKDDSYRMATKRNRNHGFQMPTDNKCRYADEMIFEKYHCLKMETQQTKSKKALLFIFGGGYIIGSDQGDFSNFLMTHFYYGSDEVLYAEAEYFAKAFKEYDARYEMHVGEGMFHCYPMMPYFPEAKEAYKEIVEILKE